MNLIYYDLYQSTRLEKFITGMLPITTLVNYLSITYLEIITQSLLFISEIVAYGQFLKANGEQPVTWKRASSMDEVLLEADVVGFYLSTYFCVCCWCD